MPILNESRAELGDQTYLNRVLPHSSIGLPELVAVEDMVLSGSTQSGLEEELVRLFFVGHSFAMAVFRLVDLNLLIIVVPKRRGSVRGVLAA